MNKAAESPRIVIIAGPNGAGKTTFAQEYLPREAGFPDFINVDLIAQGLPPFAPDKAALPARLCSRRLPVWSSDARGRDGVRGRLRLMTDDC